MTVRRAPLERLASGETTLDGAVSRYLARVLRLDVGDAFIAFDPLAKREADATIVRIENGSVVATIGTLRDAQLVASRSVTLVQSLAKGEKCDAIVRDATELGVTEIIFVATERSVVQLDGARATQRIERWSKIASEAARQSGRGEAPSITISSWTEVLETERIGAVRFALDPHANAPLAPLLLEVAGTDHAVVFAVGPEGGFTDGELETAEKQAWKRVRFGRTTLRTETVPAAFLGALTALEDLSGT